LREAGVIAAALWAAGILVTLVSVRTRRPVS
jgi:hypothetical protein